VNARTYGYFGDARAPLGRGGLASHGGGLLALPHVLGYPPRTWRFGLIALIGLERKAVLLSLDRYRLRRVGKERIVEKRLRWSVGTVVSVVTFVALLAPSPNAQTPPKEEFTAFAINLGAGRAGSVDIAVDQWSPEGDREALLKVFIEDGQDAMVRELQKRPRLGFIRLPNTRGWNLHYAVQHPLPEGGRRIVIVTDRPIGFGEAVRSGRSMDYPFTMIEIRFSPDGTGVGKMSTGTRINKSKDGQHLELETWDNEPVRLNEVKARARK
jgi:hypothetical protein